MDGRLQGIVFISDDAEAGLTQSQKSSGDRLKSEPAGRQHTQEMPARKDKDVAFQHAYPIQDVICPRADLFRRFAAGATVIE